MSPKDVACSKILNNFSRAMALCRSRPRTACDILVEIVSCAHRPASDGIRPMLSPSSAPLSERETLAALSHKHRASLQRYFERRVRNRVEAEDLIQEVFLRLARRLTFNRSCFSMAISLKWRQACSKIGCAIGNRARRTCTMSTRKGTHRRSFPRNAS